MCNFLAFYHHVLFDLLFQMRCVFPLTKKSDTLVIFDETLLVVLIENYLNDRITCTVNPVKNSHSKIDKTKDVMTNGSLMKVKSIAEHSAIHLTCIKRQPALSNNRS